MSREALGDETIYVVETEAGLLNVRMPPTARFARGPGRVRPPSRARRRRCTTRRPSGWPADDLRDRRQRHLEGVRGRPGARRPEPRRSRRGVLRAARPVGRGQDHDAAGDRGAREARHRHGAPDRHRRDRRHARRARPGDGLPVLRAVSEADGGGQHRLAAAGAQAAQGRDRRAGPARGRAAAHREADGAQAVAAVGRRDAARRPRAGAGAQPARVPDGRAADEPGPQAARGDAHRAHPHPPVAGAYVPVRDQRPGRGDVDGRPARRAAGRDRPAGRVARRRSTTARRTAGSPRSSARRA